jgi:hypothetical protein
MDGLYRCGQAAFVSLIVIPAQAGTTVRGYAALLVRGFK